MLLMVVAIHLVEWLRRARPPSPCRPRSVAQNRLPSPGHRRTGSPVHRQKKIIAFDTTSAGMLMRRITAHLQRAVISRHVPAHRPDDGQAAAQFRHQSPGRASRSLGRTVSPSAPDSSWTYITIIPQPVRRELLVPAWAFAIWSRSSCAISGRECPSVVIDTGASAARAYQQPGRAAGPPPVGRPGGLPLARRWLAAHDQNQPVALMATG
jgi:hypothetical protein